MRLWIDAAVLPDISVFGMSLLERHLRAATAGRKSRFSAICIDCGDRPEPALPADLMQKLKPAFRRQAGDVSHRLAAFLREGDERVVAVSADNVVDARLFDFAANSAVDFVARTNGMALVLIDAALADDIPPADSVSALGDVLIAARIVRELPQSEFPAFIRNLRRDLPFYLLPVRDEAERHVAERFMFRSNYKGSTDIFTRYVYPFFVWHMVRPLARLRVHPNWVTALNIVLGVGAIPAFAFGEYVTGFICAYLMSVLDSVDGKLARLTFTDSKLGTRLDHGLDLIHPPFWYLAWAWAIAQGDAGDPIMAAAGLLVVVYILDRLAVKVYTVNFQRALYAHSSFDAVVRSFIARRNINLPLFMVGVIVGMPREAFLLIVGWQIMTLVWHTCRVAWILMFEVDGKSGTGSAPA